MEERAGRYLRLVPDEWDQLWRLGQFRQRHPGVVIGAGEGWWQARIPEPERRDRHHPVHAARPARQAGRTAQHEPRQHIERAASPCSVQVAAALRENLVEVPFQELTPGPVGPAFR